MNIAQLERDIYRTRDQSFIHFSPTEEATKTARDALIEACGSNRLSGRANFVTLSSFDAVNQPHVNVVIVEDRHQVDPRLLDEVEFLAVDMIIYTRSGK